MYECWKALSRKFVEQFDGVVNVYMREWDPESVLVTTELEVLKAKGLQIGAVQNGATPESLGLDRAMDEESPAVKRLWDSHSDEQGLWSERLDVEAIPVSGPERVWAEDMILAWLPGDVRACLAVVDLQIRRAAPALVDLVPGAQGRLAIEAAVALARLAGDDTGLPRVLQATAPGNADRLRAVEALRYFGDGSAQTTLHGLQSDPDPRIRAMAAASLLHRSAR